MTARGKAIGVAEGAPHVDGRCDRYSIYAVAADGRLTVEYVGYRIGEAIWGLPLGGPGWSPPVRFTSPREHFRTVRIFAEDTDPIG